MWRRWSGLLESLGALRVPRLLPDFLFRRRLVVGDPEGVDAKGGAGWKEYLDAIRLFDAWGPHPEGPWGPYHCVPLFAALDRLDRTAVGPTPVPGSRVHLASGPAPLPEHARPGAPRPPWIEPGSWVILDLPGPRSVEAAAWLVGAARCQPVCTFDHWPHRMGVLPAERVLAELLRWATTLEELRGELRPEAPPLWVCDRERLGERPGRPNEFDNRYFLDDSVLPGPGVLAGNGVQRVVYVVPGPSDVPLADLELYFSELLAAGLEVLRVVLADPAAEARPLSSPPSPRPPPRKGYRRSSAGGFGTHVPEPSSGGGGGS